jgi:hypothetical protein
VQLETVLGSFVSRQVWFPKSAVKIEGGKMEMPSWMAADKVKSAGNGLRGFVRV